MGETICTHFKYGLQANFVGDYGAICQIMPHFRGFVFGFLQQLSRGGFFHMELLVAAALEMVMAVFNINL